MTTTEKIANAKKRIDELERLIKFWNDSPQDETKIANFPIKIENKVAQIMMVQVDSLLQSFGIDGLYKENHFDPNEDDISDWFGGAPDWLRRR